MTIDAFIDTNVLLYAVSNSVTLYSEDQSHGQVYEGVRVVNPFLELEAQAAPPSP